VAARSKWGQLTYQLKISNVLTLKHTINARNRFFLARFHRISYNITQETAPATPAKSISRKLVSFWKLLQKTWHEVGGGAAQQWLPFGLGAQNSNQIITPIMLR